MSVLLASYGMNRFQVGIASAGLLAVSGIVLYQYIQKKKRIKAEDIVDRVIKEIISHAQVHIRNPEMLKKKLFELFEGGANSLQIISDFDRTLTKSWLNGKKGSSCHGVIERFSAMPSGFHDKVNALRERYYPIETSSELTTEEKLPHMISWWTQSHNALIDVNIQRNWIPEMVKEANVGLRDGADWMIHESCKQNVPYLIFSAGVGDVLEEVVRQKSSMLENVTVVSNFMDFNEEDKMIGFKRELLHSFNKAEMALKYNKDYFDNNKDRTNVLLFGDVIGDISLADAAVHSKNIISFGFLNDFVESNLHSYKEAFDVVLVHDQTMDIPNIIIQELFQACS